MLSIALFSYETGISVDSFLPDPFIQNSKVRQTMLAIHPSRMTVPHVLGVLILGGPILGGPGVPRQPPTAVATGLDPDDQDEPNLPSPGPDDDDNE